MTFIKSGVAVLVISNVIPLVFITAAIASFLHTVCVTVNSVDIGTYLVIGSTTNVAACLSKVSIHVSLSFFCQ